MTRCLDLAEYLWLAEQVTGVEATVLAKVEGRNPAYSVKCRIGASMIWDAERSGALKPSSRS